LADAPVEGGLGRFAALPPALRLCFDLGIAVLPDREQREPILDSRIRIPERQLLRSKNVKRSGLCTPQRSYELVEFRFGQPVDSNRRGNAEP
jgi:hypothetical protein